MDPNACLLEMLRLVSHKQDDDWREQLDERIEDLEEWLKRGGFASNIPAAFRQIINE
jgi:hypothetical protein